MPLLFSINCLIKKVNWHQELSILTGSMTWNLKQIFHKFLLLSFKEKLKLWLLKSEKKITYRGIRYLTMEEDYKVPLVSQSYHSINKKSQEKKKACMC